MQPERTDISLIISLLFFLIAPPLVGFYIGRTTERRAYTRAYMTQVEAAYWEGFDDGRKPVVIRYDLQRKHK